MRKIAEKISRFNLLTPAGGYMLIFDYTEAWAKNFLFNIPFASLLFRGWFFNICSKESKARPSWEMENIDHEKVLEFFNILFFFVSFASSFLENFQLTKPSHFF